MGRARRGESMAPPALRVISRDGGRWLERWRAGGIDHPGDGGHVLRLGRAGLAQSSREVASSEPRDHRCGHRRFASISVRRRNGLFGPVGPHIAPAFIGVFVQEFVQEWGTFWIACIGDGFNVSFLQPLKR
jgi:hypothetical protein